MHRFEVLVTTALALLTTVSAAVVYTHVTAANPPDQCWIENWGGMFTGEAPTPDVQQTPGCQALVNAFWPVASEANFVASPIGVLLPFVSACCSVSRSSAASSSGGPPRCRGR